MIKDSVSLYFRAGSSDKEYHASIEQTNGEFCVVNFAYGRRGSTLTTGTKTTSPVPYEKAKQIFDALVKSKTSKGYTPGEDGTPYQHTDKEDRATGILPQLCNPIEVDEVKDLLADKNYVSMQRLENKLMAEQDTKDLFADLWQRQQQEDENIRFDEDTDAEKLSEQGRGLVACYRNSIDPTEEVLSINQAFCVPLIDQHGMVLEKPVVGEFDLIARKAGKKALVDWKTSAARWNAGKPHRALQPTMYLYGYDQNNGKGPLPEFRYDIVVKNKTPVFEQHVTKRGPDAFHRMLEKVKLAESMVAAEHFVPNDEGMFCKSCPFQSACKKWHTDRSKLISVASKAA